MSCHDGAELLDIWYDEYATKAATSPTQAVKRCLMSEVFGLVLGFIIGVMVAEIAYRFFEIDRPTSF